MNNCQLNSMHLKLEEFRHETKYSDVRILVEGKTFKCHRVVLAAASSYFDSMFSGNFKESSAKELRLYDVDAELFEEVLRSIYSGELQITEVNVFDLLRISEFLSVQTIRDPCIEFILTKMHTIENVIEIFLWASTMNILPLKDPLLECISDDFFRFSESTAFLELPFDELRAILTRRLTQSSPLFKVDELFVGALVRWLHYSFAERKDYFEILVAMIPLESISVGWSEFYLRNYKMNSPASVEQDTDNAKNKSFFKTFMKCYDGSSSHDSLPASFADYKFSADNLSIHLYSERKVFSINKYKPDGFISYTGKIPCSMSLITSSESKLLYCLKRHHDRSGAQAFGTYSSIDLSESTVRYLRPPPIKSKLVSAVDERSNRIYFGLSDMGLGRYRMYSANYKAFSNEEISVGLFHYNCELDEWFSLPQLKEEYFTPARLIIDNNILYLIHSDGHVRAYDTRSNVCRQLPNADFHFYKYDCCILNGKIYAGDGRVIKEFDLTYGENWKTIKSDCEEMSEVRLNCIRTGYYCLRDTNRMLSYENMLWSFYQEYDIQREKPYYGLSIRVYDPNTEEWRLPHTALSGERVRAKSNAEKLIKNIIVFKTMN